MLCVFLPCFLLLGVDYSDRLLEWDAVERLLHMLLVFSPPPSSAKIFFPLLRTDVTFLLKPLLVSWFFVSSGFVA